MSDNSWTEEQTEQLRKLRRQGASYGEIARRLGKTRNACIGKGNRLGLPQGRSPARPIKLPSQQAVANAERTGRDARDLEILAMMAKGHGSARAAAVHGVEIAYVDDLWATMCAQDPGGEAQA